MDFILTADDNYHDRFSNYYLMQFIRFVDSNSWLVDLNFEIFCVNETTRSGIIWA